MIRLQKIRLSFADKTLLDGLDWLIPEGARIGLVGDNGSGKTTLLRLILGEMQPDSGTIEIPKKAVTGYLPQDLTELDPLPLGRYLKKKTGLEEIEESIGDLESRISSTPHEHAEHAAMLKKYETARELYRIREGFAFESTARRVLKGLGFSPADYEKNCRDFSGGWKMRISLAAILLSQPDIMLLDEPTNHLDTESMEWLESYLRGFRGTLVAVSHDHMFLDKMTQQTAEVFNGRLSLYKGNYTFFLREKEKRIELLRKERELQKSEIKRQMVFIDRFRYKASKAAQVQSRIKLLEKFELIPDEQKARRVKIRFPDGPRSEKEVIAARDLCKEYDGRRVLDHLTFTVYRGEKVALVGVNGAGKSTLSRLISGSESPTSGTIRRGEHVQLDFFSQESSQNLDYDRSVFEETLAAGGKSTEQERRNLLGAFLFTGDSIHKSVRVLSGGEKSRLALLKLLLENTNCLILDEPTNHLDIRTKDIFQQALIGYSGTVVIVSHDRHFLDELVTRVFEIRSGQLLEYPGNYSDFIGKRGVTEAPDVPPALRSEMEPDPARTGRKTKEQRRQEAAERNLLSLRKREIQRNLKTIEDEISVLETAKTKLEGQLGDPEFLRESSRIKPATLELKRCTGDLEKIMKTWESLMAELDAVSFASEKNPY
jgi:ATP-binding cassette, subfamily F, member 3